MLSTVGLDEGVGSSVDIVLKSLPHLFDSFSVESTFLVDAAKIQTLVWRDVCAHLHGFGGKYNACMWPTDKEIDGLNALIGVENTIEVTFVEVTTGVSDVLSMSSVVAVVVAWFTNEVDIDLYIL